MARNAGALVLKIGWRPIGALGSHSESSGGCYASEAEATLGNPFTTLEKNILTAKGLGPEQLEALAAARLVTKDDLQTGGDPATLCELVPGIDPAVADRVMTWATGRAAAAAAGPAVPQSPAGKVLLDTADVVYCTHCAAKQPKDYKSGDLCIACG